MARMNTGTIRSFFAAQSALRGRSERTIGHNTTIRQRLDGAIAVRYHATDIIVYHANGDTVLSSGGWRTNTTKQRLNALTTASIYQHQYVWYIARPGMDTVPFVDGMVIRG